MKKKIKVDIKRNLWFGGWEIMGFYYGFPSCCIHEFTSRGLHEILEDMRSGAVRKLNGTGYRPCVQCNATYTEEELVARINAKRQTKRPFGNAIRWKDSERASRLGVKILNAPEKYPDVPQFILDKLHNDLQEYYQKRHEMKVEREKRNANKK